MGVYPCSSQDLPAVISSLSLGDVNWEPDATPGYSKTWKWMLLADWFFPTGIFALVHIYWFKKFKQFLSEVLIFNLVCPSCLI